MNINELNQSKKDAISKADAILRAAKLPTYTDLAESRHRVFAALDIAKPAPVAKAKLMMAKKPTPASKPIVVDAAKPLTTQVQSIAKQCGLVFGSVYNEKTKTKGHKIKLHSVYVGKTAALGKKLTQARFKEFEINLRRWMERNDVIINSVTMVKPKPWASPMAAPSITVFFA